MATRNSSGNDAARAENFAQTPHNTSDADLQTAPTLKSRSGIGVRAPQLTFSLAEVRAMQLGCWSAGLNPSDSPEFAKLINAQPSDFTESVPVFVSGTDLPSEQNFVAASDPLGAVAALFGTREFFGASNELSLPFVEETADGDYNHWAIPEFGEGQAGLAAASEFGTRSAGAYFLHVQASGVIALSLYSIAKDIAKSEARGSNLAAVEFFGQLNRLMWIGGQSVSPNSVAADVEREITKHREGNDASSPK